MDQKKEVTRVLEDISGTLNNFIEQTASPGLLSGYTGCALFFAYYYKLTGKKKYLKKVHHILLQSIRELAATPLPSSHCNGISGIAWCIQHLINEGFADAGDMADIFEEVDELLGNAIQDELQQQRYDFLHEGLGIALYFLEKEDHIAAPLTDVVTLLEKAAVPFSEGISWQDHVTELKENGQPLMSFNMGLAHGVPAIITILGMIYHKGIEKDRTRLLIERSMSWILATRNLPEENVTSLYPVLVDSNRVALTGKQSRLGWCYGDLSIATLLLNTGHWLGNASYKEEALNILNHTLQYRDARNGSVHDACLCHGSAGISHIYRRSYLLTGQFALLKGADKWLAYTLQLNNRKDGAAGFKFYAKDSYENSYGLLEGITGIGLSLIAALDNNNAPAWDRCLLLS